MIGLAINIWRAVNSGGVAGPQSALLLEDGYGFLLEDGSFLLMET